ncbi:MAG TPA: hypothetical protein VGK46_12055, partial [Saprospiraceae bacterium]
MENKDWEKFLDDLNGDLHPRENQTSGEDSPAHFDGQELHTSPDDDFLKEVLNGYSPEAPVRGWEKIAASLDAADEAFDHHVRHRIQQYHAAYDPQSWTKFAKRFSAHRHLRTRLIVVKLSEAAAILLLILTVLHISQEGRMSSQETMAEGIPLNYDHDVINSTIQSNEKLEVGPKSEIQTKNNLQPASKTKASQQVNSNEAISIAPDVSQRNTTHGIENNNLIETDHQAALNAIHNSSESQGISASSPSTTSAILIEAIPSPVNHERIAKVSFLEKPVSSVHYVNQSPIQNPTLVASTKKKYFEFGMLAQADYNQLKMPEDRLNSNGEQIIFPLEGITSPGFGAGITLAIGHPRWALETGVIYNTKSFRPSRELTIGNEADNSKVEYDAMHMQLISVPLQLRYRFDAKGRLKTYAFGGLGLNVIAQSDIDVKVDYNFPSLNEGEDPNNNPSLARTIR